MEGGKACPSQNPGEGWGQLHFYKIGSISVSYLNRCAGPCLRGTPSSLLFTYSTIYGWTTVYSAVAKACGCYAKLLLEHSRKHTTTVGEEAVG